VHLYLQGLLSHLPRKNAEDIAALVDVERLVIQEFIGTAPWDHRPLVRVLVGQVVDRLGAPDGIIAFDPSSFPKRGTHSVGVKRQWCGHRGKIDNCQVGVYMGYVARHDHALLDFRLYLPEEWARDEQRRQACHVPPEVRYHTRHEQCLEMLDRWRKQVPHGWVTGDDELGRHTWFRGELRERGERYVLGVPCNTAMRDLEAPSPAYQGRGRRPKAPWQSVTEWRKSLNPHAWRRFTVRDGEKGPVEIEMVKRRVQTRLERKRTGPAEWLVITRRPLADDWTWEPRASRDATDQDACYRYQYYLAPTGGSEVELTEPSLAELARVIKAGTCIEASFKRGKGEVGMDEYQVRTWQGWHHHMALSLLAVWFLIGETHRGQRLTPALTLPQVRYGLSLLLLEVYCTPGMDNICRQVQRQ
jgi:SRSO17 transposase